jgi:DNA-binding GntR family transcriptional regulator
MQIERPRPITEQVNTIIRQRIRDRTYPPGSRLPSESELAQELRVSRATVRTALARLAADGLVLRKQGDGTYVNERVHDIDTRFGGLWDFSRLIEANGYQPTIQTLAAERRPATTQEADLLAVAPDTIVLSLIRLFLADGRPAIYATNVIPAGLIKVESDHFDGSLPIQRFLQSYCREEIAYAVSNIEAATADEALRRVLRRESDAPLLKLIETFYNRDNQPLAFGLSYYDHTVLRLRMVQAWG